MSFFDSKEEVLNIELTQYGKYLLSKGKFQPAYYAFFDDDVVYDANYASFSEPQNASQTRILDETALNKPVYSFNSVENRIQEQNASYISKEDLTSLKALEKEINTPNELNSSLLFPLGSSSPNTEYFPAWNILAISGNVFNVERFIDNTTNNQIYVQPYLHIPQINMDSGSYLLGITEDLEAITDQKEVIGEVEKDDKTLYITSERKNLVNLFDIIEKNTDDAKEKFELEVFIEDELVKLDGTKKKVWKRLLFFKKPTNIKNNILLDEFINTDAQNTEPNETNVEFYLDISVDDELVLPEDRNLGITTPNALTDAYGSTVTDADKPFGENC